MPEKTFTWFFLNRLKNAIESIKVGDAKDYATFVNPIVNETEVKRLIEIQQKIYDAVTKRRIGKVCLHGGSLSPI